MKISILVTQPNKYPYSISKDENIIIDTVLFARYIIINLYEKLEKI